MSKELDRWEFYITLLVKHLFLWAFIKVNLFKKGEIQIYKHRI